MINKSKFDLILKEISLIETKIIEIKIDEQFDEAKGFDSRLHDIKNKAMEIKYDQDSKDELDEQSLEVIEKLLELNFDIDYFILKSSNILESAEISQENEKERESIKESWDKLEQTIKEWNAIEHNPIEEIEKNKMIGKIALEIILKQLLIEGVLDLHKALFCCSKEQLINAIKYYLFDIAQGEEKDSSHRVTLIDLAKGLTERDLFNYQIWDELLKSMNVDPSVNRFEIVGNLSEMYDSISDEKGKNETSEENNENSLKEYEEYPSLFSGIKKIFEKIKKSSEQYAMRANWCTIQGPAFKCDFNNETEEYAMTTLNQYCVENVVNLFIASNGISKHNICKNAEWKKLEKVFFTTEEDNKAGVKTSPNREYNSIGNGSFANANNLKEIEFGKIQIVGDKAFENCTSLENIVFSESVINLGEKCFSGCTKLKNVEFRVAPSVYLHKRPQNIISAFENTNLEMIVFPNIDSVTNFGFTNCYNLKEIRIKDLNTMIPYKMCKYRIGRIEGILTYTGEKALSLWKKKNSNVRFFELTDYDYKKYSIRKI